MIDNRRIATETVDNFQTVAKTIVVAKTNTDAIRANLGASLSRQVNPALRIAALSWCLETGTNCLKSETASGQAYAASCRPQSRGPRLCLNPTTCRRKTCTP